MVGRDSDPLLSTDGSPAPFTTNRSWRVVIPGLFALVVVIAAAIAGGFIWGRASITTSSDDANGAAAPPVIPPIAMPPFGRAMREQMFDAIDSDIVFLNHGSYGACPRPVIEAFKRYQWQMESDPCRFFSREVRPQMRAVRSFFAPYIGANASDIVWVENASGAINAVLRSLLPRRGQVLLHLNIAYGMVERTMQFMCDRYGTTTYQVNITLPVSSESVVAAVAAGIAELELQNRSVAIASFSHISSTPALILPAKELIDLCHQHNIPVVIDGAHALGQIPLDLASLGADWYLANGHKWLNSPKGSAFLFTHPDLQPSTHPTVISFGYDTTPPNSYHKEFEWVGTRDLTPYLAMRDATQFLFIDNDIVAVNKYQKDLCSYANERLSTMWGTAPMTNDTRLYSALTNVELPAVGNLTPGEIQRQLFADYHIEGVIYSFADRIWTRISCQIYNTHDDIDKLGMAVLEIIQESVAGAGNGEV